MDMTWCLMPFRNNIPMTRQAVEDCLAQSVPTRVLLIDQGASEPDRRAVDDWLDGRPDQRVLVWHWNPPLPSLSAAWNRGLRFVWELGGTEALVVNNDVRLAPSTVQVLSKVRTVYDALFVSAVGVKEGQFDPVVVFDPELTGAQKGGPDFSCFLLSREGHDKYPFDESFIPCYCEDLDMHRRYMLGGDGARIFSVNLPFLHYASGTIKAYSPEERAKFNKGYEQVVQRYTQKWGGPPNQETFFSPFDQGVEGVGTAGMPNPPTTPALQAWVQGRG